MSSLKTMQIGTVTICRKMKEFWGKFTNLFRKIVDRHLPSQNSDINPTQRGSVEYSNLQIWENPFSS